MWNGVRLASTPGTGGTRSWKSTKPFVAVIPSKTPLGVPTGRVQLTVRVPPLPSEYFTTMTARPERASAGGLMLSTTPGGSEPGAAVNFTSPVTVNVPLAVPEGPDVAQVPPPVGATPPPKVPEPLICIVVWSFANPA